MTESNSISKSVSSKSAFLAGTYGWMAFALFISSAVAYAVSVFMWSETPDGGRVLSSLGKLLFGGKGSGYLVLCVLEIVVVIWLSSQIRKLSVGAAVAGFIFYSAVNGLTLSSIFCVYDISSIANAFLATSVTFLVMCVYGRKTKSDLSKAGRFFFMALVGIIIASALQFVIMLFTKAPLAMLDLLISIATVIVFTGLTAYDSQKIVRTAENARDSDDYKKVSILGALELYLDFINIFLSLLRLFGKKRD